MFLFFRRKWELTHQTLESVSLLRNDLTKKPIPTSIITSMYEYASIYSLHLFLKNLGGSWETLENNLYIIHVIHISIFFCTWRTNSCTVLDRSNSHGTKTFLFPPCVLESQSNANCFTVISSRDRQFKLPQNNFKIITQNCPVLINSSTSMFTQQMKTRWPGCECHTASRRSRGTCPCPQHSTTPTT